MQKYKQLKSAICENGHIHSSILTKSETYNKKFCIKCGAKIIDCCPQCSTMILGGKGYDKYFSHPCYEKMMVTLKRNENNTLPYYCHECGEPYPWTKKFLNDYKILLELHCDEINSQLQEVIYHKTEDFLKNNFETRSVNASLLKKILNKIPDVTAQILINTISNFAGKSLEKFFNF